MCITLTLSSGLKQGWGRTIKNKTKRQNKTDGHILQPRKGRAFKDVVTFVHLHPSFTVLKTTRLTWGTPSANSGLRLRTTNMHCRGAAFPLKTQIHWIKTILYPPLARPSGSLERFRKKGWDKSTCRTKGGVSS